MSQHLNLPPERVAQRILILRGVKVMLDADLAGLYGVQTKVLNQAVKRNLERFPDDFSSDYTGISNYGDKNSN